MFLILFDIMSLSYFSLKQNNNFVVRQAFARFYHSFFWSGENVVLNYFPTQYVRVLVCTDHYLHWDSHHAITSKYSMICTLYHRARTICSNPGQLQKEEKHLFKSLRKCKYPDWALNRVKLKSQSPALKKNQGNINNPEPSNTRAPKPYIVVPYHQGLSESFKGTWKKYGIEVILKEVIPSKTSSWLQRIKIQSLKKVESYIDINVTGWIVMMNILESARNFEERFKEHLKAPSPIHDHLNISGHAITIDNFSILGREDQNLMRTIKEALNIRVNNPSLNRNIGKYHLPHIWDEVLLNISQLNLK